MRGERDGERTGRRGPRIASPEDGPSLDALLEHGAPQAGLEEAQALAALEGRLFGRKPRAITFARYVLLDRLGEGAAGIVFRAYDPELDRQVAIKLMQAGRDAPSRGRARLLREAQALARVSHPNVVSIFDVGSYDERDWDRASVEGAPRGRLEVPPRGVFIVMELVRGPDLGKWRADLRPDARTILEAYLMAAEGLSAAHQAELVHRDFKPTNVLLGEDGRVRVVDFGLVRAIGAGEGDARGGRGVEAAGGHAATPEPVDGLETAGLVGTPAYMAPEQHRGEPADARSDQYAWALSLAEALTGLRPFSRSGTPSGLSLAELAKAKQAGPAGELEGVPTWLAPLLARAMAPEPAERFESVEAMLRDIRHALEEPQRRRRRWLAFGGALGVFALLAAVGMQTSTAPTCASKARDAAATAWTPELAGRIERAFLNTGYPDAAVVYEALQQRMEGWAERWEEAATRSCIDEAQRPDASLVARERACLERRLREAHTLTQLWGQADLALVRNAPLSAAELGRPESCVEAPDGAAPRDRARDGVDRDEALLRLAEARALILGGRVSEALDLVEGIAAEAPVDAAVQAELAMLRARVAERRGQLADAELQLLEAIWAAESGHEDELAADAWLRLVWIVGVESRRVELGRRWARFAEVAVRRAGPDPLRRATLTHNRAGLDLMRGRRDEALAGYRGALAAQRELLGDDHPLVARTLNHIANVLIEQRQYEAAREYSERSRTIRAATLGPRHPLVAASLNNRATAESRSGAFERALETIDEALAITEGTGTPEERIAWHVRADVLRDLGREAASVDALERAKELDRRHARGRPSE